MNDEAARELIAAFVQVLEQVERSNNDVRTLLLANQLGRRLDADTTGAWRAQCDSVEEQIRKLRGMLATLSREL